MALEVVAFPSSALRTRKARGEAGRAGHRLRRRKGRRRRATAPARICLNFAERIEERGEGRLSSTSWSARSSSGPTTIMPAPRTPKLLPRNSSGAGAGSVAVARRRPASKKAGMRPTPKQNAGRLRVRRNSWLTRRA